MSSKSTERSHLSISRLGHQFTYGLNPIGKACAFTCLFALVSHGAFAQNKVAVNALPTGGKVVAGSASISSNQTATSATMNINQTSQRAVINWNTFNVGQNASVNFNQPNSSAVTLNRVTSATPSIVEGAIRANGQVILVNPNGVNFGKGAQVHAAGVVASTLDINNKDFMEGRSTFSGNGQGKIVNEGKIVATDSDGYIALLAPEVRNEGYLLAKKGAGSSVAMASGEKITLDFRGTQLIRVTVDVATYKGLIENKRVIETNGGLIVLAAGTARDLMSSLIQNTGRISANAIVDNGGVIDIVASNVNQAGTVSANGNGANSTGGQINIVGENITLAANSKTTATGKAGGGTIEVGVGRTLATNVAVATPASVASPQSAIQILASNPQAANQQAKTVTVDEGANMNASAISQGNGGAIVIWSQVKTVVNGVLSAVGGYLNGNGGMVETSSAGTVVLGKNLSVTTAAPKGKSGLWLLDPIDLTIDSSAANVISAALTNNNVSIAVNGNVCPSLGACTQNGSGSLTIANGASILKESGNMTTLTLTSSGIFNLNADISGQNLNVIINSSIAYLNVGSTINANQVTVQAQTIYSYGNINAGNSSNLGSAIQLLASAIYVSGGLQVGANLANSSNSNSSSNTVSYNGTLIRREDLPNYLAAANQTSVNLDQVYSAIAANQSSFTSTATNQISLTGTDSITISATAQILANGTFGGSITASAPQINILALGQNSTQIAQGSGSLIQANGNNGPGGIIALTAANDFNISSATISANGSSDGGSIRLITSAGNLILANSLIQTNGSSGRGGSLGVSAANDTTINSSTLQATGFTKGGSIMVGYDSAGKSIPFSQSTTLNAATILNASQTDGTNSTDGGFIETSGGTLTLLASINAGRGGMWLLDPYQYVIDAAAAGSIESALNQGISVSLSTSNSSHTINGATLNGASGVEEAIFINAVINATQGAASLTFTAPTTYIAADIRTLGAQTYNGNVVIMGAVTLGTGTGNLTISGTLSGLSQVLNVYSNGAWALTSGGRVISSGSLAQGDSTTLAEIATGVLTYNNNVSSGGTTSSSYSWVPTYYSSGSSLIVGAGGGGGGPGANSGGNGGGVSAGTSSLAGGVTYTIWVGLGGAGGDYVTSSGAAGGSSGVIVQGSGSIGANGGAQSPPNMYGYGGSANRGAVSCCTSANGASGIQSSITGAMKYYGSGGGAGAYGNNSAGSATNSGTAGNEYAGWGGTTGYYRATGTPGEANTGSGGGGGVNSGPFTRVGGNGADGIVVIQAAGSGSQNTLSLANIGILSLNGINGAGVSGSNLSSLNIAIGVNTSLSTISGPIKGNISLSLDSYGSANKLRLSGANTYSGSFTVYGGTLQAGSTTAFGAANNLVDIPTTSTTVDLPTIDLNGKSLGDYRINIQGTGVGANGALINSDINSAATISGSVRLVGNAYIGGPGALNITGVLDNQSSAALVLVNGATVNAVNALNSLGMISGYRTGTVALASGVYGMTVTTQFNGLFNGFVDTVGDVTLYGIGTRVSVGAPMSASGNITLVAGYPSSGPSGGNALGVLISAPITSTGGAIRIYGVASLDTVSGIRITGGALVSTQSAANGDVYLYGSNVGLGSTIGASGIRLEGGAGIDSAKSLSLVGYSSGSNPGTTWGISSPNYGGNLLKSRTAMLLAASAPNAVSGPTSLMATGGAAIDIASVIDAGTTLTINGASTATSTINIGGVSTSVTNVASNDSSASASSSLFGVAMQNSVVANGDISIKGISTSGIGASSSIGVYLNGNVTSNNGSITINGTSSGRDGITVQITYSEIKAITARNGDITLVGITTGTTGDSNRYPESPAGIYFWGTGLAGSPIVIDAGGSLTMIGYSNGFSGISSPYSSLFRSGGNMILAGTSTGAAGYGINSKASMYSGGTLTIKGADSQGSLVTSALGDLAGVYLRTPFAVPYGSPTTYYSEIGAASSISISARSTNTATANNTNYGVNADLATIHSTNGGITIAGYAAGSGARAVGFRVLQAEHGTIAITGTSSAVNGVGVYGSTLASAGQGISVNGIGLVSNSGSIDTSSANIANDGPANSNAGGITITSTSDVALGNLLNNGVLGIRVTAGDAISAGTVTGGTITSLLTVTNNAGVVGLSMAQPANALTGGAVETAVGITSDNARIERNIRYGRVGGNFTTANAYVDGNFINYRKAIPSYSYDISFSGSYSAPYGTAYNSVAANTWLVDNATANIVGTTAFGISQRGALEALRFNSIVGSSIGANLLQSGTPVGQNSLSVIDGSTFNWTGGSAYTYTITKAPLGILVTGIYNGTTTITPTSFSVTGGLVFGETITDLSSATFSGADVGNMNNYVMAISIAAGTANMNNYQLNIYGRYNGPNTSLQSAATVTPKNVTITGAVANHKYYDGDGTATFNLDNAIIVGKVVGDALGLSMAGSFADPNAANAIAVTPAGALTGDKAINYNLIMPTGFTANINRKFLNLSATKVFDGTTNLDGYISFNNSLVGTETLNYTAVANSRNVSDARYISSLTLSDGLNGGKASNYQGPTLTSAYTWNNISITRAPLGVTLSGTYNSTYAITPVPNVYGLGVGDTIDYISSATLAYKNVADNYRNYVTAITIGSGTADMNNYRLNVARTETAANNNLLNTATLLKMNVSITGGAASNKVYDGTMAAVVSGTAQGIIAGDDAQMALTTGDFASANVGTRISVTPTGSITGTAGSNYNLLNYVPGGLWANITPAPLGLTVSATYSGSNVFINPSFVPTGLVNGETITTLGQATLFNANVGSNGTNYITSYTITGGTASASNYYINPGYNGITGANQNISTINPRVLTLSATKSYDGTTNLTGAVTLGNLVGDQTLSYAATANSPNVVGATYINAITLGDGTNGGASSNYTYLPLTAVTAPLTITPKAVSLSATKTYDGTTSLAGAVTINGLVGNETLNYSGATANNANVVGASYINAISIADGSFGGIASNYAVPTLNASSAPASITPKSLNLSASRPYDGTTSLAGAVTINGLVGNETLSYSGATANSANVVGASYLNAITITDGTNGGLASNYAVPTLTSAYTYNNVAITPKLVTLALGSANKVYDGTTALNGSVAIGGLIGDETLNYSGATAFSPNVTTANNYITAITLANGSNGGLVSNYALPVLDATTAPITITARPLTITPSAQFKVYGEVLASTSNSDDGSNTATQTVNYTNGVATASYQGFSVSGWVGSNPVSTVTLNSTGALATSGITTASNIYAITASSATGAGLGNYSVQYASNNYSTLTVTPRPLYVTVANASMAYGATVLPNFSSTVTNLVNGDQANVTLATTASPYTGAAGSASNVGSYAITANSVNNANYSLVTTNGALTITPIPLTVIANTQGGPGSPIIYGTPTVLSQGTDALSSAGLVNGDYVSGATITYNNSQNISGVTAADTYVGGLRIGNARGAGLSNYTITYQPGNLIISKAPLTITAANDAKLIGQLDAPGYNGLLYSGFKNGESTNVLDFSGSSITRSNAGVNEVGTYAGVLQVSGVNSANYGITYAPGNFTVVGAGQLLVKIAPVLVEYGSTPINGSVVAAYVPTSIVNPGPSSAVQLNASVSPNNSNIAIVTDGSSTMNVNLAIANPVFSTSGAVAVGAYNLNSAPQSVPTGSFAGLFNSATTIGGASVTPKALSFADFNVSGISKVYDGNTSMSTSFAAGSNVFINGDLVSSLASGSYADRHVGTNKAYTVGVTFNGADASNYVMTGGGIYIADGGNQVDHGPANGVITQLNSVTYVGSTTGGAWSDPNSWRVTNGTALGAIPDLANVANVIVPTSTSVVYDSGVVGPVQTNVANAGNVTFNLSAADTIEMNIAGAGTLTVSGAGPITLSGANTYTGNTIVNNGATLIAGATNALGTSTVQGLGGSFGVASGIILPQLTTSGSLKIISDVTTTGNQTYGDLVIAKLGITSLISNAGNILFNGLLDGNQAKTNSLLVQTPEGSVTFNKSVGSVLPLNVLEINSKATYINADILTADQQNYCGVSGCYTPITAAQLSANYCADGDCYSKNTASLAYNLVTAGSNGDYVKNLDLGQVFIGDNGEVGFLYSTYSAYSNSVFGSTPGLYQNNPVFARTLISKDPMVNFASYINDASVNATHTMQAAAIQVPGVTIAPSVQFGGSIGNTAGNRQALYSLSALTQTIGASTGLNGAIRFANGMSITTQWSQDFASKSMAPAGVTFAVIDKNASINFKVPADGSFAPSSTNIRSNFVNLNGIATRSIPGASFANAVSGGLAPSTSTTQRNSFIMSSVSQQTKLERKYSVEASVEVGDIEVDDEERNKNQGNAT